jgi:DNA-binding transcriptional regulator YdaS (Cro superfamily)
MKLLDYLYAIPLEARGAFATRCGTSFDYLRQVGYGNRPCTERLAINLERESGRMLTCEELCPSTDWAVVRSAPPSRAKRRSAPPP